MGASLEGRTIQVGHRPARLWTGGKGKTILLLHGGWGGAETYWSTVTDDLEKSFHVVAPELPGIGSADEPSLPSCGAYADWLEDLLAALGIEQAAIVGNSFGATIAWRYAAQYPERCRALVMVNGDPPPEYSRMVRWLVGRTAVRRAARSHLRRNLYGPDALKTAFHDVAAVPPAILHTLETYPSERIDEMLQILLADDVRLGAPKARTLLLLGEADRLPALDRRSGRRLGQAALNKKLVTIPQAGHMPQIEQPAAFLKALRGFLGG